MTIRNLISQSTTSFICGAKSAGDAEGALLRPKIPTTRIAFPAPFRAHQERLLTDLPDYLTSLHVEAQFNFTNSSNDPFLDSLERLICEKSPSLRLAISLILGDPLNHAERFKRICSLSEFGGVKFPEEMLEVCDYSFGDLVLESVGPRQIRHAYQTATELHFECVQKVEKLARLAEEKGSSMAIMFVSKVTRPAIVLRAGSPYGVVESICEGFYDPGLQSQDSYGYVTQDIGAIMAFESSLRRPRKEISAEDRFAKVRDPWQLAHAIALGNKWAPLPPDPWSFGPGD